MTFLLRLLGLSTARPGPSATRLSLALTSPDEKAAARFCGGSRPFGERRS